MSVRLVIAVTDGEWFDYLRGRPDLAEVNFWAPSATEFRALQRGELFLFKLHAPRNFIVGGGVFAYANTMPCSLAWDAFGESNGAASLPDMRARIAKYRRVEQRPFDDFIIGCRILTQPFFLADAEWLPVPSSWSSNIVTFKTYSLQDREARSLWELLEERVLPQTAGPGLSAEPARYGEPTLVAPRLGQGTFRVLVTDIYRRRCALTGERTLPVLEAAHIKPYSAGGEHAIQNGVLVRSDLHKLFDLGYITITPSWCVEVSRRIKEEFENGREYYKLHGSRMTLPVRTEDRPNPSVLTWHNENRFLG